MQPSLPGVHTPRCDLAHWCRNAVITLVTGSNPGARIRMTGGVSFSLLSA